MWEVLIRRGLPIVICFLSINCPGIIRTSNYAIPTTNALIVIYVYNSILPLDGGTAWTNIFTWWLLTMHTRNWQEMPPHARVFSCFVVIYLIPEYPRRDKVLGLTSNGAGMAAGTLFQIYDHSPSGHFVFPSPCRL